MLLHEVENRMLWHISAIDEYDLFWIKTLKLLYGCIRDVVVLNQQQWGVECSCQPRRYERIHIMVAGRKDDFGNIA